MDPQNISSVPSNLFSPEMYQEDTYLILYSFEFENQNTTLHHSSKTCSEDNHTHTSLPAL